MRLLCAIHVLPNTPHKDGKFGCQPKLPLALLPCKNTGKQHMAVCCVEEETLPREASLITDTHYCLLRRADLQRKAWRFLPDHMQFRSWHTKIAGFLKIKLFLSGWK